MEQRIKEFYQKLRRDEKADKVERYRHLNRFVRKGQIVFAGSSLMEQFPIYEFLQDFQLPCTIYNRGIGGYTTTELADTLEECIFALEPSALFLNIGTNDLNGPDYDETAMLGRYESILKKIQDRLPETRLFLLAYYPVNAAAANSERMQEIFRHRTNARIHSANEGVRVLAKQFGAEYLDLNSGLTDIQGNLKAEYTIEGMHIYADGYKKVLDDLLPTLLELAKEIAQPLK